MSDIFLSYAHEDLDQARMLAEVLAGFGWTVFWDREILAGTVFDDAIQEELDRAKCVVCLWSVHSVSSQWVRAEAEEGANRNMLVSVLIEDVRLPIAFRRIQAARLFHWTGSKEDEQLKDVLKAVKFVVEKPPKEQSAGPEAAAPPPSAKPAAVASSGAAAAPAYAPSPSPVAAAKTRSPRLAAGILAGVLVVGAGGWLAIHRPAPVSDEEIVNRARQIGELLGHGETIDARAQFTTELQATGTATGWKKRLKTLGPLVEVGPPQKIGETNGFRDVQVVMKHQNGTITAVLSFTPDGKVNRIDVTNEANQR